MKKILLCVMLAFAFGSCKKERGCTDTSAQNYVASAEENDGSCYYQRNVYFWTNDNSVTGGSGTKIFVDGQLIGTLDYDFDPDISDPAQAYLTDGSNWKEKCVMMELYRNVTTTHSYHAVKSGGGGDTWDGTFTFSPRDQIKIRIGD